MDSGHLSLSIFRAKSANRITKYHPMATYQGEEAQQMHSPHRGHEERGHAGGPPRKADRAASCGRGGIGGGQPELQGQRVCH